MFDLETLRTRLRLDASGFSTGLDGAARSVDGFRSKMGGVGAGLLDVGSKLGLASIGLRELGSVAQGAFSGLFGGNVAIENVTAQLTAFTGSGDEAKRILAGIREEANKTPFSFDEMATAVASLLPASKQSGVGLMDLTKQAEILAAVNPAEGLEGAAFSLREALSGDFTSIIERFNLPRQRLNELKDQGVPAMEAISIALKEMGIDYSIVSNMANTATGRWSTFMDTVNTLKATALQRTFEVLSGALVPLQGWLDANNERLTELAKLAGEKLANGLIRVGHWLRDNADRMRELARGALVAIRVLLRFAEALSPAFLIAFRINLKVLAGIIKSLRPVLDVLRDLGRYFLAVVEDGDYLNDWLTHLPGWLKGPIKFIGKLVAAIVELGTYLYDVATGKIKPFGDQLKKLPGWLQPIAWVLGRVTKTLRVFFKVWQDRGFFAALKTLPTQLRALGRALDGLFDSIGLGGAWDVVKRVFGELVSIVGTVVSAVDNAIHGRWSAAWSDLGAAAARGLTLLGMALSGLWTVIQSAFGAIDWGWLAQQGIAIVAGIWSGIDFGAVGETIWAGIQQAFGFVKTAANWLGDRGRDLLDAVFALDWAKIGGDVWAGLQDAIAGAVNLGIAAGTFLADEGYTLLQGLWALDWGKVATDVWNGIWTALQAVKTLGAVALDAVVELAGDLAAIRDDAGTWIKNALGWTGDKTIPVGKVILQGDVNIEDTGGGEAGQSWMDRIIGFATALPGALAAAVRTAFSTGTTLADLASWIISQLVNGLVYAATNISAENIEAIARGFVTAFAGIAAFEGFVALPGILVASFVAGFVAELLGNFGDAVGIPLRDWAQRVVDTVKAAFGISSPSTVFMAIGRDLIAGLIAGMNDSAVLNYFTQIGRAIVGGLINGMASLWSQYVARINALIAAALSIRRALSIASPSKYMVDVFRQYMAGAVKGIDEGMPAFGQALDRVAAAATGLDIAAGAPRFAGMPALAAAGAGASAAGGDTYNFYTYGSPGQSVDELAEKVARKVNRQIDIVRAAQR